MPLFNFVLSDAHVRTKEKLSLSTKGICALAGSIVGSTSWLTRVVRCPIDLVAPRAEGANYRAPITQLLKLMNKVTKPGGGMTLISREGFASLCQRVRANAKSDKEEDLLRDLLVPLRLELGFDDPREGILPAGYTSKEVLWNNIRHLVDHNFRKLPYFDLIQTINSELLAKHEASD